MTPQQLRKKKKDMRLKKVQKMNRYRIKQHQDYIRSQKDSNV